MNILATVATTTASTTPQEPFWREFLTSSGFAGVLAVVAALIALVAASIGARTTRRVAARDRWWANAWNAIDLISSEEDESFDVGTAAMSALMIDADATPSEADMLASIAEIYATQAELEAVDASIGGSTRLHWWSKRRGE